MKLISAVLLLLAANAHAEDGWVLVAGAVAPTTPCPAPTVCLAWTKVTKYEDNTAIPAEKVSLVLCHVFRGSEEIWLVPCINEQQVMPDQPRGDQCYFIIASLDGKSSKPSNTACKKVGFPGPTDGKIEGPTDGAIEPK